MEEGLAGRPDNFAPQWEWQAGPDGGDASPQASPPARFPAFVRAWSEACRGSGCPSMENNGTPYQNLSGRQAPVGISGRELGVAEDAPFRRWTLAVASDGFSLSCS